MKIIFTIQFVFIFVFISSAHAYIDPNAGGFFFQTVAPIVYGFLGLIVVFWKRIKAFIRNIKSRLKKQDIPSQNE